MNLDALWRSEAVPFAPGTELAAILAARAGDEAARLAILRAYLPALRAAASRVASATSNPTGPSNSLSTDDIRQSAVLGLFEALAAFDPSNHTTLAGLVKHHITNALAALSGDIFVYAIPPRTRNRYAQVMRAAGGDPDKAAKLAPDFDLSVDTFWEIYNASTSRTGHAEMHGDHTGAYGTYEELSPSAHRETNAVTDARGTAALASVEDRIMAEAALSCDLTDRERAVVRLLYGLEGEPLSSLDTAAALGISKATVNRTNLSAVSKMRESLLASA